MRKIAVEEAFLTEGIAQEWSKVLASTDVEPGFRMMGDTMLGHSPGARRVHEQLVDVGAGRIRLMDATGIDMQILSLTAPGVQVFDPATATTLARESNDILVEAIRKHPTRLAGLAAVAPQNPHGAAAELARVAGLPGIKGLIINSHTRGEYLDAAKYWTIFEAAESLGLPLYLHPREPSPSMIAPFLEYGLYFAGWGFAAEAGLHAMRLIMSGVFERFPKLQIILGHMGEAIPFWLQRIDNRYLLQVKIGAVTQLARLPSEYFLRNFVITTSGVCSQPALKLSLEVLGVDRILFAADYPYESVEEAVSFMDHADLSEDARARIYWQNAARIFHLT
ncbi:MAG TPA: amidohydrolase family protein [Steroidobacteraceae bacterium]|jgi:2,3-dihydroxybenzoate decarboxylase|nr:amidohydrolase family protein [Steroidobacteraceae bacterium]